MSEVNLTDSLNQIHATTSRIFKLFLMSLNKLVKPPSIRNGAYCRAYAKVHGDRLNHLTMSYSKIFYLTHLYCFL